ncbi:cytochrome p450 [Fusarium beomiforme]|uniref:Cytochrome p450 n=1 Tax=Fusarium beomiforme TaxID=44412 RepID=A0A9P5A6B2_9HYPO|nr:cytochrome p450 [Fusarium beomiforme]
MASTIPVARDEDGEGLIIGDGNLDVDFAFPNSHMSLGCSRPLQLRSDIQSTDIIDTTLSDTAGWLKNASLPAEFDASFLLPLPYIDFSGYIEGSLMHDSTDSIATKPKSLPPEDKIGFEEAVIAYSTTLGSWKPSNEDYLATARAALYVPLDEQLQLGEGLGHLNPSVISGSLSSARRDEVIMAMIDGAQTAHSLQAIRMFPSAEILDKFLKVFLTTQETNASAFIHIATFDPSTCSLYLVIACIIAGAASSSRTSARKFALGLFDVLRLHLAASGERENILTRDLSRQMFRHAGLFAQHTYFHPSLMLDRPPSELDKSWGKWAQQESFKRFSTPSAVHTAIRHKECASADVSPRSLDTYTGRLSVLVCKVGS